jgi:hypothetical protein
MSEKRKEQIKESLIESFNMSYKKAMHDELGSKHSIELVNEIFEILWRHKFTENRKVVQKEIESKIEMYIKSN